MTIGILKEIMHEEKRASAAPETVGKFANDFHDLSASPQVMGWGIINNIKFANLEEKLLFCANTRGMQDALQRGHLYKACTELAQAERIMLITGFVIWRRETGETDGPPGTMALAYTLEKLGKQVMVVTDKYSEEAIRVGMEYLGMSSELRIISIENAFEDCQQAYHAFNPDHVVSIERPACGSNGEYHNMRGEVISSFVAETDTLFRLAKGHGILRTAVGDGGNELGMGNILDYIRENVEFGELIAAAEGCDNLIIAAISNWGGYALSIGTSLLAFRRCVLHADTQGELIRQMALRGGIVDGVTGKQEPTVDDTPLQTSILLYENLLSELPEELYPIKPDIL